VWLVATGMYELLRLNLGKVQGGIGAEFDYIEDWLCPPPQKRVAKL
jgi:hypothetical protein